MNTRYIEYVTAKFAVNFFKNKILELDNNETFTKNNIKIIIDPEYYESNEWISKDEKLKQEKLNWKDLHKSYYREQSCLPSSSDLEIFIPDIVITDCANAVQGYKASNEFFKSIPNSDLDKFCTETQIKLNYEHKEEYDKFVEETKKKLGIPSKEFLMKNHSIEISKKRLSLNRAHSETSEYFDLFMKEFLNNLNNKNY